MSLITKLKDQINEIFIIKKCIELDNVRMFCKALNFNLSAEIDRIFRIEARFRYFFDGHK